MFNLRGLKEALRKFNSNGNCISGTHWRIARGGYDVYWELYYDAMPVARCVMNTVEKCGISDSEFKRVGEVIQQEYPDVKISYKRG